MPEKELSTVTSNTKSLISLEKELVSNISTGLSDVIGNSTDYQKLCGFNVLQSINNLLAKHNLNHNSTGVDRASITAAIKFCMVYGLNTDNREVFVIVRNEKRRAFSGKGDFWVKKIECRPQYRGQLKIVSEYGRNVKRVYPEWIVREGDEFKYATFKGVEVLPPEWTPKSSDGKILRVVVPVEYKDGFIDYRIAERESLATNIKAQVKQSLISEDKALSDRLLALIQDKTLDELLACDDVKQYINDTYTGLSKDEMFVTKLIINATKRINIDYSTALARELHEDTFDNSDVYQKARTGKDVVEETIPAIEQEQAQVDEVGEPPHDPQPEQVESDENGEVSSLFATDDDIPF